METTQMANQVSSPEVHVAGERKDGYSALDDKLTAIFEKIKYHLETEQLFLDQSLSLVKFSAIVGTNTTYLSNAINEKFGCNLRTLINRYRINYAKTLLLEDEAAIKELPARSGFASRSAFYVAFLKNVGVTPSDFYEKNVKRRRRTGDKRGG